ncbi:MAG: hypothetical protein AAF433_20720 [Bacteroidota bacterium]
MAIIFLNSHRAKSGLLNGHRLPDAYVLAAKFFDCGIIDRTHSLDIGFEQKVLDELPAFDPDFKLSFSEIVYEQARAIWREADERSLGVQLLWSGGIDSTVALIALEQIANPQQKKRLRLLLSMDSINEYPLFFRRFILHRLNFQFIRPPVTKHIADDCLIVTGEHGDQLFGSDKLLPLIENGLAQENWELILPIFLVNKLGNARKADQLIEYLQPLVAAAPQPIISTFDLFWWLNLTIKWQQVSLRLPVFSFMDNVEELANRYRHFFRQDDFQQWALGRGAERAVERLADYKMPAKRFIYAYTQDVSYLQQKSKEPSLKNVILNRKMQGKKRYRIHMDESYTPQVEVFHRQFKNKSLASLEPEG